MKYTFEDATNLINNNKNNQVAKEEYYNNSVSLISILDRTIENEFKNYFWNDNSIIFCSNNKISFHLK